MPHDPTVAIDANGNEVRDHPLLSRPLDGDTEYIRPIRLLNLDVSGGKVDALEEHWYDDGLRGHTLVFAAPDVEGIEDAELKSLTAKAFGIELGADKENPRAGGVEVNRRPQYVYATGAFYAEYNMD